MPKVGEDLLRVFYRLFYLQFRDPSDQWKKTLSSYLRDERIVTIIPTDLDTYSLLYAFYSYLQTKSKNLVFSKLVAW